MAFYTLVDSVDEKIWPDLGASIIGQGLTVDNTLATARITATIPVSLLVTVSAGFQNIPLAGGQNTILGIEIRSFTAADVAKGQAGNTMFIDRDTAGVAINVSMIEVLLAGEYFDLAAFSFGQTLTNVEILTALQFWILDR